MGGEAQTLERVGRSRRPALWIGAWVVGLVAIVALAVVGRDAPVEVPPAMPGRVPAALSATSPAPAASVPAVAVASPSLPEDLPRVIRPRTVPATPRPVPTLGDDGLVGGTVYSSPAPID